MPSALKVQNVTKTYGQGPGTVRAVDGVSLEVPAGELVLVQGPSGSGKTTLLAMCGALLRPTSGRILLNGIEITALAERRLPDVRLRRIGFIFQSANLLANLTALENVRIVLEASGQSRRDADRRSRTLFGELRLSDRINALPRSCRAANVSGLPSPVPWPTTLPCCWPTNPPPTSTPAPATSSCTPWSSSRRSTPRRWWR
jgi:ABC-type lipoprotein export system ATPase subunit